MTPKEKAKALIDKFDCPNIPTGLMSVERKQCALVCVDEILKALKGGYEVPDTIEYYTEVKQELEKL